MKMTVETLLDGQTYQVLQGKVSLQVEGIAWDTRTDVEEKLFICVKSKNVDRHSFAKQAITQGAKALLVEEPIEGLPTDLLVIQVESTRKAMSLIAQRFYDHPMKRLTMIGITGTNGKTSASYFVAQVLEALGKRVGVIGTIAHKVGDQQLKTQKLNPTTPDAIELQASLHEIVEAGGQYGMMEVTSSALAQDRVYGCGFHVGVFTNLTQDHLEEHGTMEAYAEAKMQLFLQSDRGVVNYDDAVGKKIVQQGQCQMLTYGLEEGADLRATHTVYDLNQVCFQFHYQGKVNKVTFNVPGKFSVYNALATIGTVLALGYSLDEILEVLPRIQGVPGRFQAIANEKGILAIVDYAHSPDSLENILQATQPLTEKRLIVVFGCGGERDPIKRPIMGEVAAKYADVIVITSDNPRREDPEQIMCDIEVGVKAQGKAYHKIADRDTAILWALNQAEQGDTVVIAGKGHEDYQIIGEKYVHQCDIEVVTTYFK